jgi:hypothetical protein
VQPARHEAFTKDQKAGHLYDRGAFSSGAASARFMRNLLKINQMTWKTARTKRRQKRVTYNNMPCAKPEKRSIWRSATPLNG